LKEGLTLSIERVRKYFQQWNMADRILEFPVSSATVALAALALGCAEGRIAKTLAIKHGEGCLLVLLAGDTKLSSAKFKAAFGHKPSMLPPDETEALVGHAIGGVCPFGINPFPLAAAAIVPLS
jgi:prolyl-tRNA editing enzyme YbaK/EbsC (Cys-tRNA(Pro) deacylase)